MDWDDIDEIIFTRPKAEVDKVRCPDCGGKLKITYTFGISAMEIRCLRTCGALIRMYKCHEVPYMYREEREN